MNLCRTLNWQQQTALNLSLADIIYWSLLLSIISNKSNKKKFPKPVFTLPLPNVKLVFNDYQFFLCFTRPLHRLLQRESLLIIPMTSNWMLYFINEHTATVARNILPCQGQIEYRIFGINVKTMLIESLNNV